MSPQETSQECYLFRQYFAFSTNHLDYEIPDFHKIMDEAIPISFNGDSLEVVLNVNLKKIPSEQIISFLREKVAKKQKFLCLNVSVLHEKLMKTFGSDKEARDVIWSLTDHYLLWDLLLLEQRIVWAIFGKVLSVPTLFKNVNSYSSESGVKSYRPILHRQFEKLAKGLPFLVNDIAGRHVFREREYESPYLSAPKRVLARDNIHFKERLHLFVPMIEGWRKYGPAGITLDAQAEIVRLHQEKNKVSCSPNIIDEYQDELNRLAQNAKSSKESKTLRKELKKFWKETTIHQEPSPPVELPEYLKKPENADTYCQRHNIAPLTAEGKEKLQMIARKFARIDGETQDYRFSRQHRLYPIHEEREGEEGLSLEPDHWGEMIPPTGPLRDWVNDGAITKLLSMSRKKASVVPHGYFPYLKSNVIEYANRLGIPFLNPTMADRKFLVLRIRDLDFLCYLRTLNENEFLYETGSDSLSPLHHLIDRDVDAEGFPSVMTSWNMTTMDQSLRELLPESSSTRLANIRALPPDARYSVDYWEAADYYTAYRFFERNQIQRDTFLAAIIVQNLEKNETPDAEDHVEFSDEFSWYLPEDHRKEMFPAIVRQSVMGFIRGFSAKTIADQLRGTFKKLIPKGIQGHEFDTEIEKIQRILLDSFRFRGMTAHHFYATLLSKLCIEPVLRLTYPEFCVREELQIDGKWRQDDAKTRVALDPMARDAIGDVTDRNIFSGKSKDNNAEKRWAEFLLPLIEERCHELGMTDVVPGDELINRLYVTNAMSRNGKPGRPIYEIEKPYTCWMETLDDVKKAVAYALVRHGNQLISVSDDSFILEINSDQPADQIDTLKTTVRQTCEKMLGLAPKVWGNFVDAEVLDSWPNAKT